MEQEQRERQLAKLKRRLNLTEGSKDDLLADLLEDAKFHIKAYTGRAGAKPLPALLYPVQVELAAGSYNRLGLEGESSHSEGGVSGTYEGLPRHLQQQLDMFRLGRVGGV